ncbi:MAG: tRNA (adenosine(37)-N6)-threonylcarbamoyltransferase complex ATPase subunit type 1 TsaE [Chthoniobacterales bacterium]|jgi:tRNA threonylcarbamoyladenosine biosynthesis protein TsaE
MSTSESVEATIAIGRELAATARAGDVFALVGELGAGKTQLAKGIAEGIGSRADVTSPTFTLIHEYTGGMRPVYHFDFYRIESSAEAMRLGLDDYFYGDGVCVIEWADRFPELLPEHARWLRITSGEGDKRVIDEETR